MAVLIDSYASSNYDNASYGPSAAWNALGSAVGFSFQAPGNYDITSVKFFLDKTSSPTGSAYARIYAHSGTFGTSSVPTGSALVSSNAFDVSTVSTTRTLYELTFSTPLRVTTGVQYVVTWEAPSTAGFNSSNYTDVGLDGSSPSHAGNACWWNGSAWAALSGQDVIFELYGDPVTSAQNFAGYLEI